MKTQELDYLTIGKQIAKARKSMHYTQEDLCYECQASKAHLSHIENGRTKISLPALVTFANILDVGVDYLLYNNLAISAPIITEDIRKELEDCTPYELSTIVECIKLIKKALRNNPQNDKMGDEI